MCHCRCFGKSIFTCIGKAKLVNHCKLHTRESSSSAPLSAILKQMTLFTYDSLTTGRWETILGDKLASPPLFFVLILFGYDAYMKQM